jgi:Zn-dependent protease
LGRAVTKVLPRAHRNTEGVVERADVLIITWTIGRRIAIRRKSGPTASLGGSLAYRLGLNVPGIVGRMVGLELQAVAVFRRHGLGELLVTIFLLNTRFAVMQRHTLVVRKQGLSMAKQLRSGTLERFVALVFVTQADFLGAKGQ